MSKPVVSIMVPCFNEFDNVDAVYGRLNAVFASIPDVNFRILFIDNSSSDGTQEKLRALAAADQRVRVIFNVRNFGPVRSPQHGFFQAPGDAVVPMACDLQDPPELIAEFVKHWRSGFKVVIGTKPRSRESQIMFWLRQRYYRTLNRISEFPLIENFTGFGLYDREVIEVVRRLPDRRLYFRGIIADLGYPRVEIPFVQPRREKGVSKNDFFALYDIAMLGLTSHSRLPLRLAGMVGFVLGALSFGVAMFYLIAKLLFWDKFALGQAPVLIGVFLFGSIQMFLIGLLGEYVGSIHAQAHPRPWVIERERLNFEPAERALPES